MVQDQYTKGTGDDANKQYYSLRVSDCNRETKGSWADANKDDPENTRGTGDFKSDTEVYFVANKTTGLLSLKTQEQMTDEELRDGWHAFELANRDEVGSWSNYNVRELCP